MGGVDKGLQNHHGMPLALHALLRLGPQVGHVMINANRNLGAYEAFGVPVWPDPVDDFAGPLAGFLAGLEHCETPVAADRALRHAELPRGSGRAAGRRARGRATPNWPTPSPSKDGREQPHPVFCLMSSELAESLVAFIQAAGARSTAGSRSTASLPCGSPTRARSSTPTRPPNWPSCQAPHASAA